MSHIITSLVWELALEGELGRAEKYILLAYAEHADPNGGNIYPSIALVARRTGYCERAVQLITHRLARLGYLVGEGSGPRGTSRWRIPLAREAQGLARIAPSPDTPPESRVGARRAVPSGGTRRVIPTGDLRGMPFPRAQLAAPLQKNTHGAMIPPPPAAATKKIHLPENAPEALAPKALAPEPVVTKLTDQEEEMAARFTFSEALEEELQEAGVFRETWTAVERRLAEGWTEADALAVLRWMRLQNPDPGQAARRTVRRFRSGTKAPRGYYPPESSPEPDEDDPARESAAEAAWREEEERPEMAPIQRAWQAAADELCRQSPPLRLHLEQLQPQRWDGCRLSVAARHEQVRQWAEERLTRTLERMLCGMLNISEVQVEFVLAAGGE